MFAEISTFLRKAYTCCYMLLNAPVHVVWSSVQAQFSGRVARGCIYGGLTIYISNILS